MGYVLQVQYCNKQAAEVKLADSAAYDSWATTTDRMILGEDLAQAAPSVGADAHATSVTLLWENDLSSTDYTIVASMYLACEHKVQVDDTKRAQSRLIVPS